MRKTHEFSYAQASKIDVKRELSKKNASYILVFILKAVE